MADVIVLDKGRIKQWGTVALVAAALFGGVYFYKKNKRLLAGSPYAFSKIERAEGASGSRDVVILKDGTHVQDIGFNLKHHGSIASLSASGDPRMVLVLSGTECVDCTANEVLFVHSVHESKTRQMAFPGQVYEAPKGEAKEGELLQETRVFYGNCSEEAGPSLVLYKSAREPGYEFKRSVSVFAFQEDGAFEETFHEDNPMQIEDVLKQASRRCNEISGKVVRN